MSQEQFEAKLQGLNPEEAECVQFCRECDWQPEELAWFEALPNWIGKERVWALGPLAAFTEAPELFAARGVCRMMLAEALEIVEGSPYESKEFRHRLEKAFDESFKERLGKDAALDFERKAVADLAPLAKDLGISGKLRDLARMAKLRRLEGVVPDKSEDTRLGYGARRQLSEEESELLCLVASMGKNKPRG